MVAPSGMMDGHGGRDPRGAGRGRLTSTADLAYAAKYASAFYGPFRDAAESPPKFGDRKTHQMDPANVREALREAALDVAEGRRHADGQAGPGLPGRDPRGPRALPGLPLAAYNVSGEYAMVKAAAQHGWLDRERAVTLEMLTSIKRAGADLILTYHAKEAANG